MSDKPDEESVLGSLPDTRPTRFGAERRQRDGATATKVKATPKAPRKTAAAKPKPKAAPKPAAARSAAAKPKPAPARKPRPVRAGAPALAESTERARSAEPAREPANAPPKGTELVTTAIQAAGELAQIGLAVGGQVLKRAVERLQKP